MFKEILQLVPKLSNSDLNNMERSLSSRFMKVAKGFGKGLAGVFAGGGIAGAALGLIDKLLNPLKETQDAIDRTLKYSDDLVTNAKQFGTTSGKLLRLHTMAKATGLDPGSLDVLIQKFQASVAEAKQDPKKPTAVRNFVDNPDTASAFFDFIQALQKMDKNQQVLVQQEIFGEKQILKMADFLQSDFLQLSRGIGRISGTELTGGIDKLGDLNDKSQLATAKMDMMDLYKKSKIITEGMVNSNLERMKIEQQRENRNIQAYQDLATISNASAQMLTTLREISLTILAQVTRFYSIEANMKKLSDSNFLKSVIKIIKADW